ncbi:MAG TPA: hypothetical protein VF316_03360 [Polyangiaceae bacterium]
MILRATLALVVAAVSLSSLAGCGAADSGSDPVDVTMTGSDAVTKCTRRMYVHVIAYGYTDYASILADKNGCWGLEAPKWGGGAAWQICNVKTANPTGGARWAYDDVNIGGAGHADASKLLDCRSKNGGKNDVVYVAANSGSGWSHDGIAGADHFFNECYDSDGAMANRLSGCSSNGAPMWNIGASANAYKDTLALCKSRPAGEWIGIYAATAGLHGKEAAITKALNDCTTH